MYFQLLSEKDTHNSPSMCNSLSHKDRHPQWLTIIFSDICLPSKHFLGFVFWSQLLSPFVAVVSFLPTKDGTWYAGFSSYYRQTILERVFKYPIRQRGYRVLSTFTVTSCHRKECFSLFHATLLEGDRAAQGRSLFVAKNLHFRVLYATGIYPQNYYDCRGLLG